MPRRVWLRVNLPAKELAIVQQEAPGCELRQEDDSTIDQQWLREVDGVFTEELLPDALGTTDAEFEVASRDPRRRA
jgi:hypothetical protein